MMVMLSTCLRFVEYGGLCMTNLHLILPPYSVFMYRSLEPRTGLGTELNSASMKLSKDRDAELFNGGEKGGGIQLTVSLFGEIFRAWCWAIAFYSSAVQNIEVGSCCLV